VAAVLLAAGRSRRFVSRQKLLLPLRGQPLVRCAARNLVDSGVIDLVVVVGPDGGLIRAALRGLDARFVENPDPSAGIGTSIAAGVSSLGSETKGVAVALGDMPSVNAETVRILARAFTEAGRGIIVPVSAGQRGHPVIFDLKRYRAELACLSGDRGARGILDANPQDVWEVVVEDPGIHLDIDTAADYEHARSAQ
jgi:molybdenum cofactor cytidylyltransferase